MLLKRKKQLDALANFLITDEFANDFLPAYIKDTSFTKKNIIKRELHTPSALLKIVNVNSEELATRQPIGKVVVMIPKNSIGLTLAKAIASAYLMGNEVLVYFPAQLANTAQVYSKTLLKFLDTITIAENGQSSAVFLRNCLNDPEIKAVVIYGDDSWINAYLPLAQKTQTKVIFEGPGNDPLVVMPDADISLAVDGAINGGLNNGGQSCSAFERFFVHESVIEKFVYELKVKLHRLQLGKAEDSKTDIGPIASKVLLRRLLRQINDSVAMGAEILYGGQLYEENDGPDTILAPTVLYNCTANMPIVAEENFGPVFPIISFNKVEKLIEDLDKTDYGLNASLYGSENPIIVNYLKQTHRNYYHNSTCVCAVNLTTRLMDGGFKRSGLIWDFSKENFFSNGQRSLLIELSKSQ